MPEHIFPVVIRAGIVFGVLVWALGLYLDRQGVKRGGLYLALFATSATGYAYAGIAGWAYALALLVATVTLIGLATISFFRLISNETSRDTRYFTRLDWQRFWLYLWH